MGHKVHVPDGAGVAALDNDMPEAPKRFWTKVVELSAVQTGNFLMVQMANADETAVYLDMPPNYTLEKKGMTEVLLKTTGCEKLHPTVNAGSNYWWEKTTTLANFEKEDFTQIRGISEGRYSQGPGKRMDDGRDDVGVAENSMGSQA